MPTYKVNYEPAEHTQPCRCCGKSSIVLWRDVFARGEQCAALWFVLTPHDKDYPPVAYVLLDVDEERPRFACSSTTGQRASLSDS